MLLRARNGAEKRCFSPFSKWISSRSWTNTNHPQDQTIEKVKKKLFQLLYNLIWLSSYAIHTHKMSIHWLLSQPTFICVIKWTLLTFLICATCNIFVGCFCCLALVWASLVWLELPDIFIKSRTPVILNTINISSGINYGRNSSSKKIFVPPCTTGEKLLSLECC